jgi:hypothetical protein
MSVPSCGTVNLDQGGPTFTQSYLPRLGGGETEYDGDRVSLRPRPRPFRTGDGESEKLLALLRGGLLDRLRERESEIDLLGLRLLRLVERTGGRPRPS